MHKRILRPFLYRLAPFGVAALLFVLVGAPGAIAGTGTNEVQNPGFESGTFSSWAGGGSFGAYAEITNLNSHNGSRFSAVIGYPYRPANIDTVIAQYVHVPADQPRLTFFIRPQCAMGDTFKVTIRDMFIPSFSSVPINECTTSNFWSQRTVDMTQFAARYVELRFEVVSRGLGIPTFTMLDDVSLT